MRHAVGIVAVSLNRPTARLLLMPKFLDSLLAPADLRKLTIADLATLADEMRLRIKETVSLHGGHQALNLGTVELTYPCTGCSILARNVLFDR
jgi:1-deoxy-D-xylulose-5-phosphate synthase